MRLSSTLLLANANAKHLFKHIKIIYAVANTVSHAPAPTLFYRTYTLIHTCRANTFAQPYVITASGQLIKDDDVMDDKARSDYEERMLNFDEFEGEEDAVSATGLEGTSDDNDDDSQTLRQQSSVSVQRVCPPHLQKYGLSKKFGHKVCVNFWLAGLLNITFLSAPLVFLLQKQVLSKLRLLMAHLELPFSIFILSCCLRIPSSSSSHCQSLIPLCLAVCVCACICIRV